MALLSEKSETDLRIDMLAEGFIPTEIDEMVADALKLLKALKDQFIPVDELRAALEEEIG